VALEQQVSKNKIKIKNMILIAQETSRSVPRAPELIIA
jgi:hypothetical protein